MLITITGKVKSKHQSFIIIEANSLGYKIFFPQFSGPEAESELTIFVYEHIREDRRELYGFYTFEELEFFNKLVGVSGVGPKMAQNIMSLGIDKVQTAIFSGNSSLIQSISGVGKKTAQKIVLELKGSIENLLTENLNEDIINGLIGLGYKRQDAEEAVRKVPSEISSTEAQLKEALKFLAR